MSYRDYLDALEKRDGPGSSVCIATDYGLDGPGIESRWGRDFPPVQTGPGAHPASCTMGTGSFPGVKCGRGVLLTTHPLLAPRSWKDRAIPLPPLWATNRPVTGLFYLIEKKIIPCAVGKSGHDLWIIQLLGRSQYLLDFLPLPFQFIIRQIFLTFNAKSSFTSYLK